MAWGPLSGSSSQVIVSTGPAGLTYEGAYINRSGGTGASNKTIGLKFTEAVPTGSDYTTGMTIEVTADNGSNYETLDLSSTTQAVVDTNYVQYTLTGTVDTFQGLSGTEGQQVKISYDGSQDWNEGTITDDTTLTNASTINLLEDIVEVWHLASVSAAIDGADDLTNNNVVTFVTGKLGNGAQMDRTGPKYLSHADSARFSPGDTDWTWSFWVKYSSEGIYQQFINKWNWSGSAGAEFQIIVNSSNNLGWTKRAGGGNVGVTWGATVKDTWYNVVAYHETGVGIGINANAGTLATTSSTTGMDDGTLDLAIGAASDGNASSAVDGIMDEVAFHSKVLSSDEVTDLYNGGDGKAYPYLPDYT